MATTSVFALIVGLTFGASADERLSLKVSPARVVLGGAAQRAVEVEVFGARPGLQTANLHLDATVGTVSGLWAVSEGHWRASWSPPEDLFPRYAVLSVADVTAEAQAPELAFAVLTLVGSLDLRGTSKPGSTVRVEVGRAEFGPITADATGGFVLPIEVDPGQGWATAIAKDPLGNSSRSRINLYLPEVERLAARVFPEVLRASDAASGWLYVTSLGPAGAPLPVAVVAKAERGTLGRREVIAPGLVRFRYRPPAKLGDGKDVVTLMGDGRKSETSFVVPLMAGPPARQELTLEPALPVADGHSPVDVRLISSDEVGNAAAGHLAFLQLGDASQALREQAPGLYHATLKPRAKPASVIGRVVLVPRARRCVEARLHAKGDRVTVADGRGVMCEGELLARDARGAVVWRAHLSPAPEGVTLALPESLPANALLSFVDMEQDERVLLRGDEASPPVPMLQKELVVAWRSVSVPELRLAPVGRAATSRRVRLSTSGIDEVAARVRVLVGEDELRPLGGRGTELDYDVPVKTGQVVDVVATDSETGVSAWLRLE